MTGPRAGLASVGLTELVGLTALVVLGGCDMRTVPSGFRPDLKSALDGCSQMRADVQDWCLLDMLKLGGELPVGPSLELCRSFTQSSARGVCIELVARQAESTPEPSTCDEIEGGRMRSSCWLAIADRLMVDSADIQGVIDACHRSGDMALYCISHIPERRAAYWMKSGGLPLATQELTTIVTQEPNAVQFVDFGNGLAHAATTLGYASGSTEVCSLLPNGGAYVGCEGTIRIDSGGGTNPNGGVMGGMNGPGGGPGGGMGGGQGPGLGMP